MKASKSYIIVLAALIFFPAACSNKKKTTGDMPGMNMPNTEIKKLPDSTSIEDVASLENLLQPTDEYVVASVPVTTLQQGKEQMELNALGTISYDNRQLGTVSSRIAGRIEKLYVRYRYQYINKGQKILDIYSPELLTSQENLIFLLKNDPDNQAMIHAARQRLLLLGMSGQQIAQITRTGKPLYSVSVFSNYSGYITEPGFNSNLNNGGSTNMQASTLTTTELPVKEGMYLDKGQPVFTVTNAGRAIAYLNIFPGQETLIKTGMPVMVIPETAPNKKFRATIDLIQPFYSPGSKTLSARVYFNNGSLKLPIGSPVQARIFAGSKTANWLPETAVITTGLENVVFKKEGPGFRTQRVTIGTRNEGKVQIISGLSATDSVAINAQHLIGSESTIKTNK